jgi:predicted enzyme related to lactoylglutathione lyase
MASNPEQREAPNNRMSNLLIRVSDVERAAAFFAGLFQWQFQRVVRASGVERRLEPGRFGLGDPIGAVLHDDAEAPPVRLEFEVPDVSAALERAHRLGATGPAAALADDQGAPLALSARQHAARGVAQYTGQIGVVVLDVPDTARARAFHAGLFGRTYHSIGHGDRWWVDGMRLGIFGATSSRIRFWCVVGALETAMDRVGQLGGEAPAPTAMGPYRVCACRDDQGTEFGLWFDPELKPA